MKSPITWAWIALLLAPWLLLIDYLSLLWTFPEYRYFPFLLVVSGWLVLDRWDRRGNGLSWLATIPVLSGVLAIGLATLVWSPWLGMLGWLAISGGWLFTHFERDTGRRLSGVWILLLLLLRLPVHLDLKLTAYLQEKTARLSSFVLDWMNVIHFRNGTVFELQGGPLFVENACSGVQSLFALFFIATLIVVWRSGSLWLWPVYLLAGFLWAGFLNIVRIVCIAVAQEWYQLDLAHGWKHELLGYICLLVAIGLLLSTDRLIRVFFYEVPQESLLRSPNPVSRFWNWLFQLSPIGLNAEAKSNSKQYPLVILAVIMLAAIVIQPLMRPATTVVATTNAKKESIWQPQATLFSNLSEYQISNHSSIRGSDDITLGDNSDLWDFHIDGIHSRVAVSQPYNEFHEMTVCYQAVGWTLNERKVKQDDDWGFVVATFRNDGGEMGVLIFSCIGRSGAAIDPPDASLASLASGRWQSFFKKSVVEFDNLMIQMWVPTPESLSEESIHALTQAHLKSRATVKKSLESDR